MIFKEEFSMSKSSHAPKADEVKALTDVFGRQHYVPITIESCPAGLVAMSLAINLGMQAGYGKCKTSGSDFVEESYGKKLEKGDGGDGSLLGLCHVFLGNETKFYIASQRVTQEGAKITTNGAPHFLEVPIFLERVRTPNGYRNIMEVLEEIPFDAVRRLPEGGQNRPKPS